MEQTRMKLQEEHHAAVAERIEMILSEGPASLYQILEKSLNADPKCLLTVLNRLLMQQRLQKYEDNNGDMLFYNQNANTSSIEKQSANDSPILRNHYPSRLEEIISHIKTILPNETVVYSQWWFDSCAYEKLINLANELLPKGGKPLFLGAPTLGFAFSEVLQLYTTIADIDFEILSSINRPFFRWNECVEYDVNHTIPKGLRNQFDLVWIDPPWASRIFTLFVLRSIQFASKDAYIVVAFPQILTRPRVKIELDALLRFLSSIGVIKIQRLTDSTQYSVPLFEKRAYEQEGISIDSPWRKGDLIIFKKTNCNDNGLETTLEDIPKERRFWNQCRYGKNRVFFEKKNGRNLEKRKLQYSPCFKNPILPSVSSRKKYWEFANLITTENHGLCCSHPNEMYSSLKNGNKNSWDLFWKILDSNIPSKQIR